MKTIARNEYLERLKSKIQNGTVKIITGIRRSGKSFLLNVIFRDYLLSTGVDSDHIICISLDLEEFETLQNPRELSKYVRERLHDSKPYYVFIDEIQLSRKVLKAGVDPTLVAQEDVRDIWFTFYDVLNSLNAIPNLDIYVTGSNSKMLSKDVATNFRGRKTEVEMHPLSFAEFHEWKGGDISLDWAEYMKYGGMPQVVLEKDKRDKVAVLKELFDRVYLRDVIDRNRIMDVSLLESIVDVVSSSIGSLTNPKKLSDTIRSIDGAGPSAPTVRKYLCYLKDAYVFREARRYDVRGRRYFDYPTKYYAEDVGLRNARLGFREQESTHLMENIIFNELLRRGYSVDVGAVDVCCDCDGKRAVKHLEIDFVVETGFDRVYVQSAYSVADPEYRRREKMPFMHTNDNFRKLIVVDGSAERWTDSDGVSYIGILTLLMGAPI